MGSADNIEHYDLISLGSGEGGKYIAWTLGGKGKRCAAIEEKWLGGSCPNVACLPSKNIIHSAKLLYSHGDRFGQRYSGAKEQAAEKANMIEVTKVKNDMVDGLKTLQGGVFQKNNVDLIWGTGKFVGPKKIEVSDNAGNKRVLQGDVVIVCTGSRARIPDVTGLKDAQPLTHVELLQIEELPDHLVIIGGGYIGLEFAQAMRRFGSKVTVIEHNGRILKREDEDVATFLKETLEKEGVVFKTGTTISSVSGKSGEKVVLKCNNNEGSFEIEGSHILCGTGRTPNTDNIGADVAGLTTTDRGHIKVDEWNRATEDNVFAVGDCAGSPYFTHIGFDDFRIVMQSLSGKAHTSIARRSNRQVPFTLFTDPEFAHIGLREHEAKAKGIQYRLAKLPMFVVPRIRTMGALEGFSKVLVAQGSDMILGFSAVGVGAGELLPVVQLAMKKGLPYSDIADLVITHPTLSEGLVALFNSVPKQ